MIERFNQKWTTQDKCHVWIASRDRDGYGRFSVGGRAGGMRSHELTEDQAAAVWELIGQQSYDREEARHMSAINGAKAINGV